MRCLKMKLQLIIFSIDNKGNMKNFNITEAKTLGTIAVLAAVMLPVTASSAELKVGDTKLILGGYIKLDAIYSDVSAGDDMHPNVQYWPCWDFLCPPTADPL
jgi:hypothetical protein